MFGYDGFTYYYQIIESKSDIGIYIKNIFDDKFDVNFYGYDILLSLMDIKSYLDKLKEFIIKNKK